LLTPAKTNVFAVCANLRCLVESFFDQNRKPAVILQILWICGSARDALKEMLYGLFHELACIEMRIKGHKSLRCRKKLKMQYQVVFNDHKFFIQAKHKTIYSNPTAW
jgi:hypothetical protein